jgi:hypothetical protein
MHAPAIAAEKHSKKKKKNANTALVTQGADLISVMLASAERNPRFKKKKMRFSPAI